MTFSSDRPWNKKECDRADRAARRVEVLKALKASGSPVPKPAVVNDLILALKIRGEIVLDAREARAIIRGARQTAALIEATIISRQVVTCPREAASIKRQARAGRRALKIRTKRAKQTQERRNKARNEANAAVMARRMSAIPDLPESPASKRRGRPPKEVTPESRIGARKEVILDPHPTRGLIPVVVSRSSRGRAVREQVRLRRIDSICEQAADRFERDWSASSGQLRSPGMTEFVDGSGISDPTRVALEAKERVSAVRAEVGADRYALLVAMIIEDRREDDLVAIAGADRGWIVQAIKEAFPALASVYGMEPQKRRSLIGRVRDVWGVETDREIA
jgi:hypothetical protein